MKAPHAGSKGGIPLLGVRVLSNNQVKAACEIQSLHQQRSGLFHRNPSSEMKGAVKNRSTPESMQKVMEIRRFVKMVEQTENKTEHETKIPRVQELRKRFQSPNASSAAPPQADLVRRMKAPHAGSKGGIPLLGVRVLSNNQVKAACEIQSLHQQRSGLFHRNPSSEMKGAVKNRSTPESMQKVMEIRRFVKMVEQTENKTEHETKIPRVQELRKRFQSPNASSAAPPQADLVRRMKAPHAGSKGGIPLLGVRVLSNNQVKAACEIQSLHQQRSGLFHRNPSSEMKGAVKNRSTPESMQKVMEIRRFVKMVEQTENKTEHETKIPRVQELRKRFQSPNASSAAPPQADLVRRMKAPHAGSKGGIPLLGVRVLSNNQVKAACEIQSLHQQRSGLFHRNPSSGKTVDRNTARALESMREMERILTEKLAVLQSQVEVSQHAAPPPEELANTQTSLQAISEQMQSLTTSLHNIEASRKQDLEVLRAEMQAKISKDLEAAKTSWSEENLLEIDNKLGRTVDRNTARALESMREEMENSD
ncbi:uncharacterized protein [Anas platyrhynchos]